MINGESDGMSTKAEEAIDTVAQHVIATLTDEAYDEWETFPDIGEHDWERVVERVSELARFPERKVFQTAYDLLASRAENDA